MRLELDDPRLMDYVLGELENGDALDVAAALQLDENKEARELVEELRGVANTARRILHEEDAEVALSDEQRAAIVGTVGKVVSFRKKLFRVVAGIAAVALFAFATAVLVPTYGMPKPVKLSTYSTVESPDARHFAISVERVRSHESEAAPMDSSVTGRYIEPETSSFETPDMTPDEIKEHRVREHLKYGEQYQEAGLPSHAVEIYSHVLESDPNNAEAKDGLEAASKAKAAESPDERAVAADADRIQQLVENGQLPAGANALGIKSDPAPGTASEEAPMVEARNRLEVKANLNDGFSLSYENGSDRPDQSAPNPGIAKNKDKPKEEPKPAANVRNQVQEDMLLDSSLAAAQAERSRAVPPEEQWAEYNVGNLTGQTALPEQVASNHEPEGARSLGEGQNDNLWQWNTPTDKPTEIAGGPGTETYVKVAGVKPFVAVKDEPLSTFSIDVDTAAYSNVRRFLSQGQLPPADAVRIEEMINYFAYSYPQPTDGRPFAVAVHGAPAPWAPERQLVRVGVKGKEVPQAERPLANLVFLLDVSGSMQDANKLPLVKESMKTLLSQLRPQDRVGIVTYAGDARLVLGSTVCSESAAIAGAIDSLQSGGGTNGGGGIQMAYDLAQSNFIQGGINRVIVATDGDFNVGTTAHGDLMSMIEARAKSGVFLTTLGFGMGNLKDSTLEQLANRGNGNYAYIDNHAEARKALVDQLSGTLQTIAKDVKIQVEFNPAKVSHYRLLGYENRALANQDFNDDTKDAGEIGAGHTVTALYEIIPAGGTPVTGVDALKYQNTTPGVDPLKYQDPAAPSAPPVDAVEPTKPGFGGEERIAPGPIPTPMPEPMPVPAGEWLTVKMRYKQPEGNESTKIEVPLLSMNSDMREVDTDFRFASAVAAFGQVLRNSGYQHPSNYDRIVELARGAANGDADREAFVDLVITAKTLSTQTR